MTRDADAALLERVQRAFEDSLRAKRDAAARLPAQIARAGALMAGALESGGKILACGNGGSAADAQHFAAEMVNRFERERPARAAIALTTDSSALTSIANDTRFEEVFARQVEALGRPGDVLLAISTSGRSANVLAATGTAQRRGMTVVLLSGRDGGGASARLAAADVEIRVPAQATARIQEVHILVIHCLCDLIDFRLLQPQEHSRR